MPELLAMGGYAPYVWTAWALALLVLAGNVLVPLRRYWRLRRALGAGAGSSDDEA